MKSKTTSNIALAVAIAVSFAVVALAAAAPPAGSSSAKMRLYVSGHAFGIGEQQVYLVDRESQLTVRFRDPAGQLHSKVFHSHAQSSVAWTIEGLASGGMPVMGVATAAPVPSASSPPATALPVGVPSSSILTAPSKQPSPQPAPPSPTIDAQGATETGGALDDLSPASILLSGITTDFPQIGKAWKSSGDIRLPYGTMTVSLENTAMPATGDQDPSVMHIGSTGATTFHGEIKLAGFGTATLRGGGPATGTSFLESLNRLLLGMSLSAASHGNASAKDRRGSYDLSIKTTIKLIKYVPGIVPFVGSPGFVPASGYLGGTTAPDTGIYSTAVPTTITIPAPTDTGFLPLPPPAASPYRSALPAMSLPPIPLPMASDQPAASPPAGPTPTPQPTHY
ncbi:MAG: hypothetical protein M3Z41_08745 [Candidatus Eremiobacteraeota bacterium]|nr:hypothetical protein [Candidatus Eremiobacteraeota bacterium]